MIEDQTHGPSVASAPQDLYRWLHLHALPLWFTVGRYDDGRFTEALTPDGANPFDFQRARVSTRQIYVLAEAGRLGWAGPWRSLLEAGLDRYWTQFGRAEGDFRTQVALDGRPRDETVWLYDQAFSLLAMASAFGADVRAGECRDRARRLLDRLEERRLPAGGWREAGDQPYQANCHMHLLEAFLAWDHVDPTGPWKTAAASVVDLALSRFIDPASGALHEFFDAQWNRLGDEGLVEPGHQFEWAWLLTRWGHAAGDPRALEAAHKLYRIGSRGVLPGRDVICDELNADLSIRSDRARLWPQTEWLKAALLLGARSPAEGYAADSQAARRALAGYLLVDGRWRDKQVAAGRYLDEPAPASSLYHIVGAIAQLRDLEA